MSKVNDYELAFVDGIIRIPLDGGDPVLDLPPTGGDGQQQPAVIVGDLRLSDFRRVLQGNGIKAEFREGGVLVCNDGTVSVRKSGTGKLVLEGILTPDYYKIRGLLYGAHAIL
jgi:cleavage and polyadenylation specificity factor subunit 2